MTTQNSPKIYSAIADIISEIGAVAKSRRNQQQGFNYRGVDDVMNALQPMLAKRRVFIVPQIIEHTREDRQSAKGSALIYSICTIKYTFYAEDGSSIEAVVVGEGMDSGDKATNKAMAIAFKYACFQVFCIPTEEMTDPDASSHDLAPRSPATTPKAPAPQSPALADKADREAILRAAASIWTKATNENLSRLLKQYTGFATTKEIPKDRVPEVMRALASAPRGEAEPLLTAFGDAIVTA
jgi:hypothetical protein